MTTEVKVNGRPKPRTNWLFVVAPGLVVAMLGGVLLSVEALRLGPLGSPALVASYNFGSESMVGVGGWRYLSRSNYVTSSALEGTGFLICAAVLGVALIRRRTWWLALGYTGLVFVLVAAYWPLV